MKKTTKSTPTGKTQTPRKQRHASSGAKPVTIELKAEKVATAAANTKSKSTKTTPPKSTSSTAKPNTPGDEKRSKDSKPPAVPTKTVKSDKAESSDTGRETKKNTPASAGQRSKDQETKKPPIPTSSSSKSTGGGPLNRFATALLGGCVALIGVGLVQYSGILETTKNDPAYVVLEAHESQTNALRAEIETLRSSLREISAQGGSSINLAAVNARIDERMAQLDGDGSDIDAVVEQVNKTTLLVEQLLSDQAASTQAIAKLETALRSGAAGDSAAVAAVAGQLDGLLSRLDGTSHDLSKLKEDLAALTARSQPAAGEDVAAFGDRLSAVESSAGDLAVQISQLSLLRSTVSTTEQVLKQQQADLSSLQSSLEQARSPVTLVGRAIAAATLKSDIDRGVPFENSLATLQKFSPGNAILEKLQPYAKGGIPTVTQLLTEFEPVGSAIIAATQPMPDDDLASRLMAGVKSFVTVKTTEPVAGSSATAITSQIAGALQTGELQAASELWTTLPAVGREISEVWHDKLQARIIADELISNTVQSFLNSTAIQ